MISQAASDGHMLAVWLLLTAASAGVFLHAGIKFPWFVFFQKDSGLRPSDPPRSMRWAMIFFALLCIAIGVWPEPLYGLLPYAVKYQPVHGRPRRDPAPAAAVLRVGVLRDAAVPQAHADDHAGYRLGLAQAAACGGWHRLDRLVVATWSICERGAGLASAVVSDLVMRQRAPDGSFVRTSSIRAMALWVLVLLLGYLVLYYL